MPYLEINRIVDRRMWLQYGPDRNFLHFVLVGNVNDEVYDSNTHTEDDVKLKKAFGIQCLQFHQQNSDVQ